MALHSATLGGQVGGPLEAACGGGGSSLTSNPSQALATSTLRPTYIKYAPTPYGLPGSDPYANAGNGLVPYVEEKTGQSSVSAPIIQMQQFSSQSQRLVQPPSIIDTGYYMQPCWNTAAPEPSGVLGAMIGQPQQSLAKQQQQSNFEEPLINNGCTIVVSCSSSLPNRATVGCGSDRRLIASPMGPPLPTTPIPGGPYGPRFAPTQLYHHNSAPAACIPQQPSTAYMSMPTHPHNPTCLSPGFAGAPTMNGQRLYTSSPQGNVWPGSRMPTASASMRASTSMPFGYFQMAPPPTEGVTAAAMCPTTVPDPFVAPHGPSFFQSGQQGPTGSKSEPTTTKKKRTKVTKSRGATARGGNSRGTGVGATANASSRVVAVCQSSAGSLIGSPTQMMGPGIMLSTGVSAPPQSPLWAPRPLGPIMTDGAMMSMAPPSAIRSIPCGLSPKVIGPPLPPPNTIVHAPGTPHQYQHTTGSPSVVNSIAPPPSQSYAPPVPQILPLGPAAAERLVCPITNGTVVRPMMLQLDEDQTRQAPNTLQVRSFEFDVSKNHLETIVERPDLDIVVCSHLVDEPLQVCHWPAEAVHIRFNGTVFQLDRTTTFDGQPAHRVCGVKALCRPSRNLIEVFLSPSSSRSSSHLSNYSLKDHRFALFMAHMPAVSMVLDGLLRRVPDESLALTKLIAASWRSHQASNGGSSSQDQRQATPPPPTLIPNQSVAAQISLVCPVFRTRMQIPGRIVGCHHLEVFDMEAYLHREAIWSRLLCPICGNGNPAGLDNLYIDYFLLNIIQLIPKSISSIHVSSDGFWRLSPPLIWQLPPGTEQWQPIIGPPTCAFAIALKVGPTCLVASPQQPQPSLFQSHQEPITTNGLDAAGRRPSGTMVSTNTAEVTVLSMAHSSAGCANSYHQTPPNQSNADVPPYSNCPIQVATSASPKPISSSASMVAFSVDVKPLVSTSIVSQSISCRKRVLSTSCVQRGEMLHPMAQTEEQVLPNSMPDLRVRPKTVSNQTPLPKSLPTTPTSPISTSKPTSSDLCINRCGDGDGGFGMGESGAQSYTTSPQPSAKRPNVSHRQLTDEEVRWAFDGLPDLNYLNNSELIRFIESLP